MSVPNDISGTVAKVAPARTSTLASAISELDLPKTTIELGNMVATGSTQQPAQAQSTVIPWALIVGIAWSIFKK